MSAPGRRVRVGVAVGALVCLAACGSGNGSGNASGDGSGVGDGVGAPTGTDPVASGATGSPAAPPPATGGDPAEPITIAFAGDVHFEGQLADRLQDPSTALGPMAQLLAGADLAVVNLETAITTGGDPEPKEFTFRAPPTALTALREAGVDVVTMANNHGLDFGPVSVPDALAASRRPGCRSSASARTPPRRTSRGSPR